MATPNPNFEYNQTSNARFQTDHTGAAVGESIDLMDRGRSSFSFATSDDEFDEIVLPPPPKPRQQSRPMQFSDWGNSNDRTPLVATKNRKKSVSTGTGTSRSIPCKSSSMLFGQDVNLHQTSCDHYSESQMFTSNRATASSQPLRVGMARFFFGFMYEDTDSTTCTGNTDDAVRGKARDVFIPIKLALCLSFMLTSAATTAAVTIVPVMGKSLLAPLNPNVSDITAFTSRAASSAVLGLAIGKFVNGPLGDIMGARKVSMIYSAFLTASLVFLSLAWNESSALWACFFVEFFQSVQWPGIIVILASHAPGNGLEAEIYVTLLSSRCGSLLSLPLTSLLLRYYSWRVASLIASLLSFFAAGIFLIFVRDSPAKLNDPQNPINSSTRNHLSVALAGNTPIIALIIAVVTTCFKVFHEELVPSIWAVITRSTFWVVAIAHAGDAIVGSSQRVLGRYYYDTSGEVLSENRASSLAVLMLSFGTIAGLAIGGNIFTTSNSARNRKKLVVRLYIMSIVSCYMLAILAIPRLQGFVGETDLILAFQLISTFFMGFGAAVQSYIPGIVGATFGKNKGLFSAYTDGIAYGLSSIIWKIVAGAVFGGRTIGWVYGWAAVALLIVVCALLMVEFFENYFVRGGRQHGGIECPGYETIIFV